jgi:hypothetical protein
MRTSLESDWAHIVYAHIVYAHIICTSHIVYKVRIHMRTRTYEVSLTAGPKIQNSLEMGFCSRENTTLIDSFDLW